MKSRILFTAIVASFVVVAVNAQPVAAQAPRSSVGGDVAVIDVAYILKNHRRFDQAKNQLTTQFETAAKALEEEKKEILQMQQGLAKFNPGTPDYRRLDEQVTQRQADWNVKANKHRKEIQERQASILANVYVELTNVVKQYSMQNGIGVVIQFNGEPIDPNKTFDTAQAITRPLVYVAPNRDITPHILALINQNGGNSGVSNLPQGVRRQ
ncbi:MAG: OmpH family outer membrane protein [Pirellulales bacterium]